MSRIAIITRTKNRLLLLRRAFNSIVRQSYRDYVWVLVNDGGEKAGVEEIAAEAVKQNISVFVIHNGVSLGMEAASNIGIQRSQSEYITLLDDDDTWDRLFLEKSIQFLDSVHGHRYGGVACRVDIVEEIFDGNSLVTTKTRPFNHQLRAIYLTDVAKLNCFNTNSFVYRRSCYESIGGYDENLVVVGDWDFNLRFLLKFDIGFISETLAYWHQRPSTKLNDYGNSITHRYHEHEEYDAIVRNKYLRQDIEHGRTGLGYLLGLERDIRMIQSNQPVLRNILNTFKYLYARIAGMIKS